MQELMGKPGQRLTILGNTGQYWAILGNSRRSQAQRSRRPFFFEALVASFAGGTSARDGDVNPNRRAASGLR